jgi:hypothetical protein
VESGLASGRGTGKPRVLGRRFQQTDADGNLMNFRNRLNNQGEDTKELRESISGQSLDLEEMRRQLNELLSNNPEIDFTTSSWEYNHNHDTGVWEMRITDAFELTFDFSKSYSANDALDTLTEIPMTDAEK